MEQQIAQFRQHVEAEFGRRPGRGARYSRDLRSQAVALVQRGLAQGKPLSVMARELGRDPLAGDL